MIDDAKFARRCEKARLALKEVFGHDDYRPFQQKVVEAELRGHDVFAVAATGGGKALAFQLPAVVLPGVAIIVSPLIALMKDQVDKLNALGLRAVRLTSDLDRMPVARALRDFDIVYVSPEKAKTAEFRKALKAVERVSLFALDECHTATRWSDFRPAYAALGDILDDHPEAVRLACTATADTQVEADVNRLFRLRNPVRVVGSPWRDNIEWVFARDADDGELFKLVEEAYQEQGSQLVYVSSRREAERVADMLQAGGVDCQHYHAGMEHGLRTKIANDFIQGTIRCMAATTAFGMGVDKPDIRLVANWQLPSSLFDLLQQTGRASRDGQPAVGWVNLGTKAERTQRYFIECSNPPFRIYDRLWAKFAVMDQPQRWSTDILERMCGIQADAKGPSVGYVESAMSYLEFTGHISSTPAGVTYKLPVRPGLEGFAAKLCSQVDRAKVVDGVVRYDVPPGQEDRHSTFLRACNYDPPSQTLMVKRLRKYLEIGESEVAAKKDRAVDALQQITDFAQAANRRAFVNAAFAQGNG